MNDTSGSAPEDPAAPQEARAPEGPPLALIVKKRPPRFSDDLRALAAELADRPASLGHILKSTEGRGFELLLLLISVPFVTPLPLPGLSTLFGTVILVIGARLALGRKPWLPARLLSRELPARFTTRVLSAAGTVVRWLEVLTKPRLDFLHSYWIYRRIAGVFIMLSGLMLLLPLPVPLTNSLPAAAVILLCAGAMERDGLFFLAGSFAFALAVAYFVIVAFGGVQLVDMLWDWVKSWS